MSELLKFVAANQSIALALLIVAFLVFLVSGLPERLIRIIVPVVDEEEIEDDFGIDLKHPLDSGVLLEDLELDAGPMLHEDTRGLSDYQQGITE